MPKIPHIISPYDLEYLAGKKAFILKTAVRITQSNGATEKSKPYTRNSIHQKGESQKCFFKKILI